MFCICPVCTSGMLSFIYFFHHFGSLSQCDASNMIRICWSMITFKDWRQSGTRCVELEWMLKILIWQIHWSCALTPNSMALPLPWLPKVWNQRWHSSGWRRDIGQRWHSWGWSSIIGDEEARLGMSGQGEPPHAFIAKRRWTEGRPVCWNCKKDQCNCWEKNQGDADATTRTVSF